MTKVVVDTNVYISALVFGGVPRQALDVIESKQLPLYISPSIRDEVTGILLKKFGWSQQDIKTFLPPLWQRTILVRPTIRLTVCVDPDDNHVLECAETVQADFLITGNKKHFPDLYRGTSVVNARDFLERLRNS